MASVLKQYKVRDWMTPNPITISPRTTLPEAHQIMKEKRIRRLPGTIMVNCMIGSRSTGPACWNASLKASRPAIWKEISLESTGCSLPS